MKKYIILLAVLTCLGLVVMSMSIPRFFIPQTQWKFNTSNLGKLQEFRQLFAKYNINLSSTHHDLTEIDSHPVEVAAYKASQVEEYTLIEDTSLDIEGANVGINVRWMLDHIETYVGRKAVWSVLLAYRVKDTVYVYRGEVKGTIVPSHGRIGFGFDPVFLPEGADKTLAESKPDHVNARFYAVDAFVQQQPYYILPAIYQWDGPWQQED